MPKDVVVVVNIDAKPSGTENLDILLLSTEGAKDVAVYRDLDVIKEAFTGKKVAAMAEALFEQGKTTLAETLIRKVKIAGIAAPSGSGETEKASALVQAVETLRETDDDWYTLMSTSSSLSYLRELEAKRRAVNVTISDVNDADAFTLSADNCRVMKMPDLTRNKEQSTITVNIYAPSVVPR